MRNTPKDMVEIYYDQVRTTLKFFQSIYTMGPSTMPDDLKILYEMSHVLENMGSVLAGHYPEYPDQPTQLEYITKVLEAFHISSCMLARIGDDRGSIRLKRMVNVMQFILQGEDDI